MDFLQERDNTTDTESSYGHCRCCLEEGYHRNITKAYLSSGSKEIYADILLDCFNVFLSTHTNLSTLICSDCVAQLRAARDFKALVLRTEEQLMEELQKCDNEQMVLVNVPIPKETLGTTVGFKIEVNDFGNFTETKQDAESDECAQEVTITLNDDSNSDTQISWNDSNKPPKQTQLHIDPKERLKRALIVNTYNLLQFSNATLFRSKMRSAGFPCFYCRESFEEFDHLRQHQTELHPKVSLLRTLKLYTAETLVVYADVQDLKCTVCDITIPSLKEFKEHLIEIHKNKFYSNVTDRVVPFKVLENYFECQICAFNFETFGSIEKHMNTHYRNYVCNFCGAGFITTMRLKKHMDTRHRDGTFPCDSCKKVFRTQQKLRYHVDFVHKMLKKVKCSKCTERFSDYFLRKKHMVKVHGEKPVVYRCNVCNKGYQRRYTLACHMKRHMELKDVKCDICTYSCYNKTELREHMLKHYKSNIERSYVCSICSKNYSRRKSLKIHMKSHMDVM
ncbi:zinc finger protein draculin-like isoform X7 [Ostrinia furnacalis]|uniref:zinc finger protein draculin-like isoform X7 n=1 Tax=Ostrinia furnacalis TaxID=93504 RepID=UPI00103D95F2|nr:zinc finger protein draculin-like isoform X7 [Ostrinia furnacalis]